MSSSMYTSLTATRQSGEFAAAERAARQKMEELASVPFASLCELYKPSGSVGNSFPVVYSYTNKGDDRFLPGLTGGPSSRLYKGVPMAGEIIIVTDEGAAVTSAFDLDGNGVLDPVNYAGGALDLNANGTTTDGDVTTTAVRLPVGVVIRWLGVRGQVERYELWTVFTKYN